MQAREEEEEDRGEKRREARGLEEERCTAAGERRGGGGQKRKEKKRREILIGADQDQDLFFSIATLSCFQTRSFVFGFLSLALLRKPNREAKAWRRWWWWCWSTRLHSVRKSRAPTSCKLKHGRFGLYIFTLWFVEHGNFDHNHFEDEITSYTYAWATFVKMHACDNGKFWHSIKVQKGFWKKWHACCHYNWIDNYYVINSYIPTWISSMFFHMDSIREFISCI